MSKFHIETIDPERDLNAVIKLGDVNKKTLGFLPYEAFQKYATEKTILVAVDNHSRCVGYLLYRITNEIVSITHLCVKDTHRRTRIGESLVKDLIEKNKDKRGIKLKCKTEYDATQFWPKLDFAVVGYREGRGRSRDELVVWWLKLQDRDLFSRTASDIPEPNLSVVVDVNVLIDLLSRHTPQSRSSNALQDDWLRGKLELCVTAETFNEIGRNKDRRKKREIHDFAESFICLECDHDVYQKAKDKTRQLFPDRMNISDESDHRQISRAIAAGASCFVTRDKGLINKAEDISEKFDIEVLSPTELILQIDKLSRIEEYRPARFAGSSFRVGLVGKDDIDDVVTVFRDESNRERKSIFLQRVNQFLSSPKRYKCNLIKSAKDGPVALYVTDVTTSAPSELEVPLLRVKKRPLASTLARKIIYQCLMQAASCKSEVVKVTDSFISDEVAVALDYFGFFKINSSWTKISIFSIDTGDRLASKLDLIARTIHLDEEELTKWKSVLSTLHKTDNPEVASEQEHLLWPAKVLDSHISTYIVPIKPQWAQDLFDESLSEQRLFQRKTRLAVSVEGIYYTARKDKSITTPARILWYVSRGDGRTLGAMHIRFCSRLNKTEIAKPKTLYRKYKHLGIYEWRHISRAVKGNLEKELMALNFSDTEPLKKPIHWSRIQEILKSEGCKSTLVSLTRITNKAFAKIYSEATNCKRAN